MAGQFSDLLTADDSAEVTHKDQDSSSALPQCRKLHGPIVFIVGCNRTNLVNGDLMLGHIFLLPGQYQEHCGLRLVYTLCNSSFSRNETDLFWGDLRTDPGLP